MKNKYLVLTVIGTLLPNIFVLRETIRSGNILLYTHPLDTLKAMFVNNISTAFIIDLLFILLLFLVWSYGEAQRLKIRNIGWIWVYTFAFGIAGGLPLFLYVRTSKQPAADKD